MRTATYDIGIAWEWQYDADFIRFLLEACTAYGVSYYTVTPDNLGATLSALNNGALAFKAYFDRASDSHPGFVPLTVQVRALTSVRLNDFAHARRAWDKSTMHLEFMHNGIEVPHTLILPPFDAAPNMPEPDLGPLGRTSYLKPARGGGGEGVVLVTSWTEIQSARQKFPHEKYLLSALVTAAAPEACKPKRAWFRVIYAAGAIFPSWWDERTHVYTPVTPEDEECLGLETLRDVTRHIADIAHLELFSTEIALTEDGHFIAVDYVNDPCDLRLQSKAPEAVPDGVVRGVADALAKWVAGKTE